MGIVNLTPDSFSDGGRYASPEHAVETALEMVDDGARIVDVGGESTRPGAAEVSTDDELDRVLPFIRRFRRESSARISIDTQKAEIARAALDEGADLVNDVSALRDPAMLPLVAERGCPVAIMHMRGSPQSMQDDTNYDDLVETVRLYLAGVAEKARAAGVAGDKIIVDPGIGFGKSAAGNVALLRGIPIFNEGGYPILIGASRKSFLGKLFDLAVDERLEASVAAAVYASMMGAHLVRVHDVRETVRSLRLVDFLQWGDLLQRGDSSQSLPHPPAADTPK